MDIKNESKLDLKKSGLLLDCGSNLKFYKVCKIHDEIETNKTKYNLYTDLSGIRAIDFDSNGNINSIIFMNAKNIENILSDRNQEVTANKKYWQKRLQTLREYKELSIANLENYKKEIFQEKLKFASTSLGSIAFAYGIGNTTYNYSSNEEASKLLWSLIIAGFSFEYYRTIFEDTWNKLSVENLRKSMQIEDLKQERNVFLNYDLPVALYYNILFECLKEYPDKDKIESLNNERKEILQKEDELSIDVEKFIRVR